MKGAKEGLDIDKEVSKVDYFHSSILTGVRQRCEQGERQ